MSDRPGRRTLLTVHAHPDDECISTGGVLARYAEEGVRTVLVTCTGGEVGEISDPTLASPDNLASVRARELARAVEILGITRSAMLGFRDSGMVGTPDNENPANFHRADPDEATGRLVRIVREERPQVVVTYDENGGYGHPDHIQAHRVAVGAFEAAGDPGRFPKAGPAWAPNKLYYAVFSHSELRRWVQRMREVGIDPPFAAPTEGAAGDEGLQVGVADERVTTVVDVARYVERKHAALMAHRTQVGSDNFFARLPMEVVHELWAHERFQRVAGPTAGPPNEPEADLFAGLP